MLDLRDWDAIMFDFDGVLVESLTVKTDAFALLYREHGPEIEAKVVAHHSANGGMSRYDKFRIYQRDYLGRKPTDADIDALAQRFGELVEDVVCQCEETPGAGDLLKALRGNRPIYVISATPTEELERIIERRGLRGYFDEVRGSPRAKQDHILELIAACGASPERVLFVGDAINDYNAATAAGVKFVGRAIEGSHPFPEGTWVVDDMRGLMPKERVT